MRIKLFIISLLACLFIFLPAVYPQVNADFSANPSQGCAPLVVNFINNSTGTGTLTYQWNFGNGNSSNLATPSANYPNPGVYTVTLIVSNGTNTDTLIRPNFIVVYANPASNFAGVAPLSGCIPLTVSFNDLSVPGDGAITNWQWDFGDGNTSGLQNPSNTYTQQGIYAVSLQVTDEHGCKNSKNIQNYIIATAKPVVQFSAIQTDSCSVPIVVNFTNTSTGYGTLSYFWDFGDGNTSNQTSPSNTYTAFGNYTVKLVVTNQYGCSDSLIYTDYISITQIQPVFHTVPADTACIGQQIDFINDSGINVNWAFGDGATSLLQNPVYSYSNSGTYTITLTAAPGTACQNSATGTIVILPPAATGFSPSTYYVCQPGGTVDFIDSSPDAVSWQWSFGNGQNSTQQNPSTTYPIEGNYTVSVTITDSHGCSGSYTDPVPIVADFIEASFSLDPDEGCVPLEVTFTDNSYVNSAFDNIASWSWDFGNGDNSILQNPIYTYNDTGTFQITLTIISVEGCTDSITMDIDVGDHHVPIIDYSYTGGCANDTVHFISLSTDSTFIDFWQWTFENDSNFVVGTGSEAHPDIYFDGNGTITIEYIIGHNGCRDTLYDSLAFHLNGPFIMGIDTIFSCTNPYHIGFTVDSIKEVTRWYWDFDGDSIYDTADTMYYVACVYNDTVWFDYDTTGTFTVTLIAYNDTAGCFYEEKFTFRLYDIKADLVVPSPTCNDNVPFDVTGSFDWNTYTINYGNGQTLNYNLNDTIVMHTYLPLSAEYDALLIMTNFLGCSDSDSVHIRIFEPVASFVVDQDSGCAPFTVTFISTSTGDTTLSNTWYFPGFPFLYDDTVTMTFPNLQWYDSYLVVEDAVGCQSISPHQIIMVISVQSSFTSLDSTLCLGDTAYFNSQVPLVSTYVWNFGDSTSWDTITNPYHLYNDTGKYSVSLIVSNSYQNCIDTVTYNQYVSVQDINVDFWVADSTNECYPFAIDITNNTDTVFNPIWFWSFGDGAYGIQHTPFHSYNMPGSFWLSCQAVTTNGCTDRDSLMISINGPYMEISLSDTSICKGEEVIFSFSNMIDVNSMSWDFGDGNVYSTSDTVPVSHIYNYVPASGYFNPSIIYCSDVNCCTSIPNSITGLLFDSIRVAQVMAIFYYTDAVTGDTLSASCQPGSINFHNISLGPDSCIWSLGDGTGYTGFEPSTHTYYNSTNSPVTYDINLIIYNSIGCIDSMKTPFTVYPVPVININEDVAICYGSSTQLSVTGDGTNIFWAPPNGLSNVTSFNPSATPDSTTTYYALIYDSRGCINGDSVTVYVQLIPSLLHNPDTTIIVCEQINLFAVSDVPISTYVWSPDIWLTCTDCPGPVAQPLVNTEYTVVITDTMNCFQVTGQIQINVREEFSIDLPTAFTPNGDGENDVIYARGWGIKDLIEFKVYNRWGECIFQTDDKNTGWDGTFKGIKQNIDTYAYTVTVNTCGGKILTKNGLINLLR